MAKSRKRQPPQITPVLPPSDAPGIEEFVNGGKTLERQAVETSEQHDTPLVLTPVAPPAAAVPSSARRVVTRRRDGTELRRLTIYLPIPLFKRLAGQAAEDDRDMSTLIAEALQGYLRSKD